MQCTPSLPTVTTASLVLSVCFFASWHLRDRKSQFQACASTSLGRFCSVGFETFPVSASLTMALYDASYSKVDCRPLPFFHAFPLGAISRRESLALCTRARAVQFPQHLLSHHTETTRDRCFTSQSVSLVVSVLEQKLSGKNESHPR